MDSVKRIYKILRFFVSVLIIAMTVIIVVQRLTNNKTAIAGIRIFTVVTESMVPKYNVGDVLLVMEKKDNQILVGDDVAYQGMVGDYAGKVITHRVKRIGKVEEDGQRTFVTRGIAPSIENDDPEIKSSQIFGTVVTKLYIMTFLNGIINNNYGMYFLIVIPLAFIIFTEIKGFKKDKDEILDEEDDEFDDDYDDYYDRNDRRSDRKRYYDNDKNYDDKRYDDYYEERRYNEKRYNDRYNDDKYDDDRSYNQRKYKDRYDDDYED